MPIPKIKKGKWPKERERNKDGTWRKKRSDTEKPRDKKPPTQEEGRQMEMRQSETIPENKKDYYETLPGKLSLRLNIPDLGLIEDDQKDLVDPVQALMDEVDRLNRIVGEQAIKLKAYERENEVKTSGD